MAKSIFYSVLFTVFTWLGGALHVVPAFNGAAGAADQAVSQADAANEYGQAVRNRPEQRGATETAKKEGSALMRLDPGTFLWELILFLVLLGVLAKFIWPPILKGLQQREEKIRGDLERAEQASNEATAALDRYEKQVADARKEAQRIIEQSRADAQKVAAQIKEQGQADLKQMRERAESEIEAAQKQAVAEIYEQTAALATQVAGQILQREIQPEDHRELVERSLEGLSARRN